MMTQQATGGMQRPARVKHLSEDDYTAGSQPDLMQWVTVTDLAGDVS